MSIFETNQQVFDHVVSHLRRQGKQSSNYGTCLYRGPGGLKCAIGACIPDDLYSPALDGNEGNEGVTIGDLFRDFADIYHSVFGDGVSLQMLKELQTTHDGYNSIDSWESEFMDIAKDHHLEYKREE